ncbi:cell surface glycoprotein CD200 receptor 1-A-like [Pyxicephalus adspersus]|uniref:cell surface glycoprotein CD200 receptor 1-A-like n=1 Tax=Pyxicephalus adspersus TaxID=30357 RepID=UPI003B5BD998
MIVLILILGICGYTLTKDVTVVVGRRGTSTVLQCGGHGGDQLVGVIWKIHHNNNSSCLSSYAALYKGGPETHTNCSTRITLTNTSLTIQDTQISDGGNYTCEISDPKGTFIYTTILQVLVQPSVSLDVGSSGLPECKAIGGFPAAEISWIPHPGDINTTKIKESDDTWTVISTDRVLGVSVTCFVSHPTFSNPWNSTIQVEREIDKVVIYILVGFTILILTALCIIHGIHKHVRVHSKNVPNTSPTQCEDGFAENTQEFEPYATYTQKENILYCEVPKVTQPNIDISNNEL